MHGLEARLATIFSPLLGFVTQTCGKITAELAATAKQLGYCVLPVGESGLDLDVAARLPK